jgi:hypothetical protein
MVSCGQGIGERLERRPLVDALERVLAVGNVSMDDNPVLLSTVFHAGDTFEEYVEVTVGWSTIQAVDSACRGPQPGQVDRSNAAAYAYQLLLKAAAWERMPPSPDEVWRNSAREQYEALRISADRAMQEWGAGMLRLAMEDLDTYERT